MIKNVMEVNKKVGVGAQKNGVDRRAEAGLSEDARRLVERVRADHPELRVRVSKRFMFRPPRTVVVEGGYGMNNEGRADGLDDRAAGRRELEWELQFLHEVGHALAGHRDFRTDPERLKMEREAWERARELCAIYNIRYDEEFVEAELDTYREWLHRRSLCRKCGLTRYQTQDGRWHCPGCGE